MDFLENFWIFFLKSFISILHEIIPKDLCLGIPCLLWSLVVSCGPLLSVVVLCGPLWYLVGPYRSNNTDIEVKTWHWRDFLGGSKNSLCLTCFQLSSVVALSYPFWTSKIARLDNLSYKNKTKWTITGNES